MKIYGKEISKNEIQQKTGDISQLGGVKYYEMIDGVSRGVRAIDVKSPAGLDFTVLPDRGMDISSMSYKSIPVAWRSVTKDTSPIYYESQGLEWLRTFYGGLLMTCGLTYNGPPTVDDGVELGLHGKISNISAEKVLADGAWEGDRYKMWVQGRVREAQVFGDKLELSRKITTWMDEPMITVEDTVENIGSQTSPLMVLYHVNIGFPIVDSSSELIEGKAQVEPRDDEARDGADRFNRFGEPTKGYKEKVYWHDISADDEGYSNAALVNEKFDNGKGIGIWMRFKKDTLPFLAQWKQMGIGDYVCGIEPCNSKVRGRDVERKEGLLKFIEPGETVDFRLEFNILGSNEEIAVLKNRLNS